MAHKELRFEFQSGSNFYDAVGFFVGDELLLDIDTAFSRVSHSNWKLIDSHAEAESLFLHSLSNFPELKPFVLFTNVRGRNPDEVMTFVTGLEKKWTTIWVNLKHDGFIRTNLILRRYVP